MGYQIIIHGGANDLIDETDIRNQECQNIVLKIEEKVKKGMSALDACEFGVNLLEDNPMFNAGTGGYLQLDGQIRLDASIMDSQLRLGSVIQITNVKNPISVARKLLERSLHGILSAQGANEFAREQGFPIYNPVTAKQMAVFQTNIERLNHNINYDHVAKNYQEVSRDKLGTVGCVVRDESGLIVAGTSTGGLKVCFPGRVGDSGLPGCGTYANEFVGVSATGIGEKIMRISLTRLVSIFVAQGSTLTDACQKAIDELEKIGGVGGVIAISHTGEICAKFNAKTMSFAIANS